MNKFLLLSLLAGCSLSGTVYAQGILDARAAMYAGFASVSDEAVPTERQVSVRR